MTADISYTTEEIAKLLKISKLTVYDLIKKGDLPAYRVGKQMRVDASDLEAYKVRAKGGMTSSSRVVDPPVLDPPAGPALAVSPPGAAPSGKSALVITGQDISLDILAKHIERKVPGSRPLRSYVGSLDSLIAMYRGETDIVSTHLLDGDTGEYNIPYVRKILIGSSYIVIRLVSRSAGLYVQRGNPKGLHGWADLGKKGLRLINREKGSGARVLLDEQLRLHGISYRELLGYDQEESNHMGVAGKVATGEGDFGVGIEKAASMVGGVDFVPLIQERVDLVMLKKPENLAWIERVKDVLQSEAFHNELRPIQGYDLSQTGRVMFET
ncbi:substrate-binding domain-containing protein [Paenibacillus sp. GCM10023248]|uniref:helix-turn-helix transcriptional regulator n=1 Tax=unclassified Paenibacillus TaxID=185978 RepID=UPI002377F987|nr:helix-turn-helix transcriptional regulator [Paenibacillus sp. MAHUQ-63]MDD9266653.1 helix-turn-helix transcriptional regulator [Paenibacillus sp. MAHUQ-63]